MARDRASRPEARPLRLFVAADVPDEVKGQLDSKIKRFRDRIPGARWTRAEGWHVTLKFLGATWPRLLEDVRQAVRTAAAASEAFETKLTSLGVFPSQRRARVVWAGLADPEERFAPMVKLLDELLSEHFEPEKRRFTSHLTLARLNPARDIGEFAPTLLDLPVESAAFRIDRLVLYVSHLSPRGATYEPLETFPFGAGSS